MLRPRRKAAADIPPLFYAPEPAPSWCERMVLILKNLHDMESIRAALDEFLQKENSVLDKYDIFTRKIWLTVGKPEPQAAEFARVLKNLADSFAGGSWKILYKLR